MLQRMIPATTTSASRGRMMNSAATVTDITGPVPGFFASATAGADSLVKGSKSPTRPTAAEFEALERVFDVVSVDTGEIGAGFAEQVRSEPTHTPGTLARLYRREWSDEWRICLEVEQPSGAPPEQNGDRITRKLSARGARAMGEACEFVTQEHGGFTTFLTLTLDQAGRESVSTKRMVPDKRLSLRPEPRRESWGGSWVRDHGRSAGDFCRVGWRWTETGREGQRIGGQEAAGPFCRVLERAALSALYEAGEYCDGQPAAGPFCRLKTEWVSSIQREASRFFDAVQKMHRRGWVPPYRRGARVTKGEAEYTPIYWNTEGRKLGGRDAGPVERLHYLWVAENPENEQGERNPHIHVLIKWAVPWEYFPAWAHRIERLWGQGFAHLERLKAREAAGYYIAKAAGYLTKAAGESDQGPIRGNRYGIASASRAPGWQPVLVWAWGVMGHLLREARERYNRVANPIRKARNRASGQLKELPKGSKERHKTAALLQGARRKLKALPIFGRLHAVFRGGDSVDRFLQWAERQGWRGEKRPPRMWLGQWLRQWNARRQRRDMRQRFIDEQESRAWWDFWSRLEPVQMEPEEIFLQTVEG